MRTIATLCLSLLSSAVTAADVTSHDPGIWSITPTDTMNRWVIIHNLPEAIESGIFHIEVIGCYKDDATWQVQRLVKHMAITREALEKSVITPLNSGAVYPEVYEDAYSAWRAQNQGEGGTICKASVLVCM